MGERIDAEEVERGLRFLELDVKEKEFRFPIRVIGLERGGDEGEFRFKRGESELSFGVELLRVEEY